MKSNCLVYALSRLYRDGGYLVFRKSPHWWGFQTLWSDDLKTLYLFAHHNPGCYWWQRSCPPLWFAGSVRAVTPEGLRRS
jgi:hypothetical protein